MEDENMCKIPIRETIEIINGKAVTTDAEYVMIPGEVVARFLIKQFGMETIFGRSAGGNND